MRSLGLLASFCLVGLAYVAFCVAPTTTLAHTRAVIHCNKSADADACHQAAGQYMRGDGVWEDDATGLDFMLRACDLGRAESCTHAIIYVDDLVHRNQLNARAW